jgi:hypothetical protein
VQNNSDWPDNPGQRAINQHFIDTTFGQKKRDAIQAKAALNQAVTDWLNQPGPDGQPQTDRPPLSVWTLLSPEQQQAVDTALAQNADPERTLCQPTDRSPVASPVASDPDYRAALAECRESCNDKFESGLFRGWAGIPASDQPSMMRVCIRECMEKKGFGF